MVGQCDCWSSVFGGPAAEAVHPAGSVEERILGVDVEMYKFVQVS